MNQRGRLVGQIVCRTHEQERAVLFWLWETGRHDGLDYALAPLADIAWRVIHLHDTAPRDVWNERQGYWTQLYDLAQLVVTFETAHRLIVIPDDGCFAGTGIEEWVIEDGTITRQTLQEWVDVPRVIEVS